MMENTMENLRSYGAIQSLLDTATFYVANSAVSSGVGSSKPKIDETIIFLLADMLVRNNFLGMDAYVNAGKMGGNFGKNAYIGLISFVITNFYDLIQGKEFGRYIKDNLIKNAVGVGGNTIVDLLLSKKYA